MVRERPHPALTPSRSQHSDQRVGRGLRGGWADTCAGDGVPRYRGVPDLPVGKRPDPRFLQLRPHLPELPSLLSAPLAVRPPHPEPPELPSSRVPRDPRPLLPAPALKLLRGHRPWHREGTSPPNPAQAPARPTRCALLALGLPQEAGSRFKRPQQQEHLTARWPVGRWRRAGEWGRLGAGKAAPRCCPPPLALGHQPHLQASSHPTSPTCFPG